MQYYSINSFLALQHNHSVSSHHERIVIGVKVAVTFENALLKGNERHKHVYLYLLLIHVTKYTIYQVKILVEMIVESTILSISSR